MRDYLESVLSEPIAIPELSPPSLRSAFQNIAILSAVVTAIIPGLALKIFLAFVPSIILTMNKFAGMVSLSQLDMGLVSRFFVFQVGWRGVGGAGGGSEWMREGNERG